MFTPCWKSLTLMWILHAAEATSAGLGPCCPPYGMPKYLICLFCIFPGTLLCELPEFVKELSPVATEAFHSLPIIAVNDPLKPNISIALVMLHPQNLPKAFSNVLQIKSICSESHFSWSLYETWNSLVFIQFQRTTFYVLSVNQQLRSYYLEALQFTTSYFNHMLPWVLD